MPPEPIFDVSTLDFSRILFDREAIRLINPQRFEMEQLHAILVHDPSQHLMVGYRDIKADEFWVRGHMPGYPLMPGILMCEAAAQLCSYYTMLNRITEGDFLGFSGMENVRFRGIVRPGDRFVIVSRGRRMTRRQCICSCQGFVGSTMVFQGEIIGMPMMKDTGPSGAET